ncbi:hypothetical protein [Kitasatospora sp. NPDC002040]|uniref:hypothetical protein n=1 Tax=Kitasatospora sp. NPDC002040 TaxID=3154661 RepID=UPI00332A8939
MVRDVVAEVAPAELPLLVGLAALDDATVVRRLNDRVRRSEPLGFGLGEIVALVTPVVWLAADQVAQRAAGAAVDRVAGAAGSGLRRLFRRSPEPVTVTVPPLSPKQIVEVRQLVLDLAADRGLDEQLAVTVAESLAARLALAALRGTTPGPDDAADGGA